MSGPPRSGPPRSGPPKSDPPVWEHPTTNTYARPTTSPLLTAHVGGGNEGAGIDVSAPVRHATLRAAEP